MTASSNRPIKYTGDDSNGTPRFAEISDDDKNRLAYDAGLKLSEGDSDDVGSLTLNSEGNASVGSYSNTEFNESVGAHGTSITSSTTTTTLHQKEGSIPYVINSRKPLRYSQSENAIHEMNEPERDSLAGELVRIIFANDYPGAYRLGSSSPGSGWSVEFSGLFTDTRTDGYSTEYNLYRRTAMDEPAPPVKPLFIRRIGGNYAGFRQMNPVQVKDTFGADVKKIIMSGSNGPGTYLLLSSVEGTPEMNGYSGTWSAKGAAADTRQAVSETSYTRTRTSSYIGEYSRLRASSYARSRSSSYARSRASNYSRDFTGDFTAERTEDYSRAFVGNYLGEVSYTRTSAASFSRTVPADFIGNYTGNFSRYFARSFAGDFTGNYVRTASYSRSFTGDYTGNFTGEGSFGSEQYALQSENTYYWSVTSIGGALYLHNAYWDSISRGTATNNNPNQAPEITSGSYAYGRGSLRLSFSPPNTFIYGIRRRLLSESFTRTSTRARASSYSRTLAYTRISTRTSTRNYARTFLQNFIGNYTGDVTTSYTGNFIGNYTGDVAYAGNYTRNYSRTFTRTFTRARSSNYSRDFVAEYSRDFTENYSRNITDTYTRTSVGDFLGNYTGDEIQSSSETIETYTLYVRTA